MKQAAIPKLSELGTAGRAELLATWIATLGKPPIRASRELLASALAWHLQERKFGGLKPATKRKLRRLARAQERKTTARSMAPRATNFRPGTVIIKQWRGAQYTVVVLADGFQHQGKVYASLSQLAREITGTRWNGPAFFGLRNRYGRAGEVPNDAQ